MRDGLRLSAMATMLAMAGLLLAACGSGDHAGQQDQSASDTVRSERQYRQASVLQQQDAEHPERAEHAEQTEQMEQSQVDVEIAVPSEIDFGHREGLPFTRNVVGDPDAPVLVIEYSDYQ